MTATRRPGYPALVRFLTARIDEDGAAVYRSLAETMTATAAHADHITRHDPLRVMRLGGAVRGVLHLYQTALRAKDWPACTALEQVVRVLAEVYGDHPDYPERLAP